MLIQCVYCGYEYYNDEYGKSETCPICCSPVQEVKGEFNAETEEDTNWNKG